MPRRIKERQGRSSVEEGMRVRRKHIGKGTAENERRKSCWTAKKKTEGGIFFLGESKKEMRGLPSTCKGAKATTTRFPHLSGGGNRQKKDTTRVKRDMWKIRNLETRLGKSGVLFYWNEGSGEKEVRCRLELESRLD